MFGVDLKVVPRIKDNDKTILEIGKYPHYENVISNYLQFYMNPKNNHGFGDLLLKILFKLWYKDNRILYSENIFVQREVTTEQGRIDILIIGETFVIAIENKIFHNINNPLKDYKKYLDDNYDGFEKIGLVLSLKKEKINDTFFKSVTYGDIIDGIRKWLNKNYNKANNLYDLFFLDMMKSIENLMKKNNLDLQVLEFLAKNKEEITNLNEAVNSFHEYAKNKIDELDSLFELTSKEDRLFTNKRIWNQDWIKRKLENVLLIHLNSNKFNGANVNIKIRVSPKEWRIEFWDIKSLTNDAENILLSESREGFQYSNDKGSKHIICKTYKVEEDVRFIYNELMETLNKIRK